MRISRLYTPTALAVGKLIELDEDNAHYVRTVLRLKQAAEIIVFNGDGGEYLATLTEVSRKQVLLQVRSFAARSAESPLRINLGLGVSRGDRMDFAVQKAVELGVSQITPIMTERCVVQFKGDKQAQRLEHWQKIVQHAAEQSGRTLLPPVQAVTELSVWVTQQQGLCLFLDPYAEQTLAQLTPPTSHVTLLTGPEGGFAEHERALAKAAGFVPVRLGARILRTETASLAALAAVQMLWGDFAQ